MILSEFSIHSLGARLTTTGGMAMVALLIAGCILIRAMSFRGIPAIKEATRSVSRNTKATIRMVQKVHSI